MSDIEITLELLMKSQTFQKAMKAARGEFDQLENELQGMEKSLAEMSGYFDGFIENLVAGLAQTAVLAGFDAIKNSVSDIVQTVSETQQLNSQLQALTKSSEEYAETQVYLQSTAIKLSADVTTLSKSYAQLLVLRDAKLINVDESRKLLEGMSDYAARMGVTNEQVGQAMYGLSQALGSGTVRAEELNQVTEALPGSLAALGEAAGTTAGGFRAMVNDGKVSSEMFKDLFITALSKYEGAAAATAANIAPTFTRLTNEYTNFKQSLESPVVAVIMPMMQQASATLQQFIEYSRENSAELTELGSSIGQTFALGIKYAGDFLLVMTKTTVAIHQFASENSGLIQTVASVAVAFYALNRVPLFFINITVAAISSSTAIVGTATGMTTLGAATLKTLALLVTLPAQLGLVSASMGAVIASMAAVAVTAATIYAVVQAYDAWQQASSIAKEQANEFKNTLKQVDEETKKFAGKSDNIKDLGKGDLEAVKQSLIQRLSQLEGTRMAMESAMENTAFGIESTVDKADYAKVNQDIAKFKEQLTGVKTKLTEVKEAEQIKVELETQPLKDGIKDVEAFYTSVKAIGDGRIATALDSVKTASEETIAALQLNGDNAANSQRIVQTLQQASTQIVALESARAQQEIEFTERVAVAKAEDIRKTVTDQQQASAKLRELANEVADARIASTQKAYEATRSQLEKAKQEYQKYAEVAKGLEQSISGELARQADVVQDLTRKNMSAAEQYASRKQELATLSGNFESAIAEGNYQKAEEIARKQESLAQQVAEAAKNAGVDEPQANTESLDLVKQAHERINEAMTAQKKVADDNAASQLSHVKNLTTSMDTLAQTLQGLQDKQIDLKLNVNQADLDKEFADIEAKLKARDFTVALKFAKEEGVPEGGLDVTKTVQEAKVDPKVVLFNPDITKVNEAIDEIKKPTESTHTIIQKTEEQVAVTVDDAGVLNFNDTVQTKITPKTLIINPLSTDVDNKIAELKKPTESTHTIHVKQDGSSPSGYAGGGLIQGEGTETSDSILARLSRNEYVMPAYTTNYYGARFFDKLRRLELPKFANGGLVGGNVNTNTTQNSISTIVNNLAAQTAQSMTPVTINVSGKPIKFDTDNAGAVEQLVRELTGRTRGG